MKHNYIRTFSIKTLMAISLFSAATQVLNAQSCSEIMDFVTSKGYGQTFASPTSTSI